MARYIAFLRAVNVGGRVVKMDELKQLFQMPGIKNISTYIQSGNVIFDATADKDALKKKIENKLLEALGYEVPVFLKTFDDIRDIIKRNPYKADEEEMALHISMLSTAPDAGSQKLAKQLVGDNEDLVISGTEAYIRVPKGNYGSSKLSNANLEKKMKVQATTRNWATMNKILALE